MAPAPVPDDFRQGNHLLFGVAVRVMRILESVASMSVWKQNILGVSLPICRSSKMHSKSRSPVRSNGF